MGEVADGSTLFYGSPNSLMEKLKSL